VAVDMEVGSTSFGGRSTDSLFREEVLMLAESMMIKFQYRHITIPLTLLPVVFSNVVSVDKINFFSISTWRCLCICISSREYAPPLSGRSVFLVNTSFPLFWPVNWYV